MHDQGVSLALSVGGLDNESDPSLCQLARCTRTRTCVGGAYFRSITLQAVRDEWTHCRKDSGTPSAMADGGIGMSTVRKSRGTASMSQSSDGKNIMSVSGSFRRSALPG